VVAVSFQAACYTVSDLQHGFCLVLAEVGVFLRATVTRRLRPTQIPGAPCEVVSVVPTALRLAFSCGADFFVRAAEDGTRLLDTPVNPLLQAGCLGFGDLGVARVGVLALHDESLLRRRFALGDAGARAFHNADDDGLAPPD